MKKDLDKLSNEETAKRRDEAIRRALSPRPKQNEGFTGKSTKNPKIAPSPKQSAPKGRSFRHQGR